MKYLVKGRVTVSCWTEVEATNPTQALMLASRRELAEIIIDPSYEVEDCFHMANDGAPFEVTIELSTPRIKSKKQVPSKTSIGG